MVYGMNPIKGKRSDLILIDDIETKKYNLSYEVPRKDLIEKFNKVYKTENLGENSFTFTMEVKPVYKPLTHWEKFYEIDASHPKHIRKLLRQYLGEIHNLGCWLLPSRMDFKNYLKSKPVKRNIFKFESYDDIHYYREFLILIAKKEYKKAYKLYWEMDTFPREFIASQFGKILEYAWNGEPYC